MRRQLGLDKNPIVGMVYTPVIPTLEMLRQKEYHEFQNSQGYIARSVSKTTTKKSQV